MNVLDIIRETSARETTRFSFELLPPLKGDGTRSVFTTIEALREFDPAFINVTFHRESIKETLTPDGHIEWHRMRRRPGTVGISAAIRDRFGIEVVPHLICGGLSRYDIEDALIDMDFLGLHNVLALRGDKSQNEKRFMPHPQGHAHAVDLVRQIADMNRGKFIDGEVEDCHRTNFCIGVAGYPEKHCEAPNPAEDMRRLKEKVDAGADYIITQMSFDNASILAFIENCRAAGIDVPIIPGIKPFSTKAQLTMLPQIFHVDLPEALVREVEKCPTNREVREVGVEWAVAQGRELIAAGVPILHFYTMGKTDNMVKIAQALF